MASADSEEKKTAPWPFSSSRVAQRGGERADRASERSVDRGGRVFQLETPEATVDLSEGRKLIPGITSGRARLAGGILEERGRTMAADDFLKIAGVKGESKDIEHKEEIEVDSFSW